MQRCKDNVNGPVYRRHTNTSKVIRTSKIIVCGTNSITEIQHEKHIRKELLCYMQMQRPGFSLTGALFVRRYRQHCSIQ